ncbi:ADP-ribosylation/Crystallin J1 [Xylaria telfairii]|nr:ADP-ribosylation/Crystallin J1 [Xylaria telfairii]
MDLRSDEYLGKVYAGVLGKLIGVYLGRPFEGWTHQRILQQLGHVRYYVNDQLNVPLVVTDDDVSGTFTFIRAIEEHYDGAILSAEAIGKTWLNNVIYRHSVFFWGGKGIMTEHTAYVNLRDGIVPPMSGAMATNGSTIAEQIGAEIFIDGWDLVAPGKPSLAAKFAEAAASVSHDGEAVHAAKLWASMESEAFISKNVDHLLDTGLKAVPSDSLISTLIEDIRQWCAEDGSWEKTRQRIEDKYGYDKFSGICHVIPNHGLLIMALIYGGHDFSEAMHIISTCGWDTDSNGGNLGCLVAIMHGLVAFDGNLDWRGPIVDRVLVSSADGGYSINNAARLAFDIANMGRKLARKEELMPPKDGAQFHFTLPGSVQGVEQGIDHTGTSALAIRVSGDITASSGPVEVTTPTSSPLKVASMQYELVSSPLVYPGQTIRAVIRSDPTNSTIVPVRLMLKAYSFTDQLESFYDSPTLLSPNTSQVLEWAIPSNLGGRPIESGTLWLVSLGWHGTPKLTFRENGSEGPLDFYKRAFVAQDNGEGIVTYGTRDWADYKVTFRDFVINIGDPVGVEVRVQGLNRYYALEFVSGGHVVLLKALDKQRIKLATAGFDWKVNTKYLIFITVERSKLQAQVGNVTLSALDKQYQNGGVGLVATNGSLSLNSIDIGPITD